MKKEHWTLISNSNCRRYCVVEKSAFIFNVITIVIPRYLSSVEYAVAHDWIKWNLIGWKLCVQTNNVGVTERCVDVDKRSKHTPSLPHFVPFRFVPWKDITNEASVHHIAIICARFWAHFHSTLCVRRQVKQIIQLHRLTQPFLANRTFFPSF